MVTTRACHSANKEIAHHDGDEHNAGNCDGGIKENDGIHNVAALYGERGSLVLVGGTVGDDTAILCSSFSSNTRHLVIVHPLVSEFVAYTKNDPGPQQYIFMASLLLVWNEIPR